MQPHILPRRQLTEHYFRRFEHAMAEALQKGMFEVEDTDGLSPKTYCARFSDAKLAFKRYQYRSDLISVDSDLDSIKAYPMTNGHVLLRSSKLSLVQGKEPAILFTPTSARDRVELLASQISSGQKQGKHGIVLSFPEDLQWLKSLENLYDIAVSTDSHDPNKAFIQ